MSEVNYIIKDFDKMLELLKDIKGLLSDIKSGADPNHIPQSYRTIVYEVGKIPVRRFVNDIIGGMLYTDLANAFLLKEKQSFGYDNFNFRYLCFYFDKNTYKTYFLAYSHNVDSPEGFDSDGKAIEDEFYYIIETFSGEIDYKAILAMHKFKLYE